MASLLSTLGNQLASTLINTGVNKLFNVNQPSQGFNLSALTPLGNQAAGAGLLAAGYNADKEPGQVTEARQFLRNQFTSPNALADQFGGQVGALKNQFQPYLDQQANTQINALTQRYKNAFPATAGAQGPEFGGVAKLVTDEILPQQNAFLGNLGLGLMNQQSNAAKTILDTNKPDPLAQLMTALGYDMLTKSGQTASGGSYLPGGQGTGSGQIGQAAQSLLSDQGVQQLIAQLAGTGTQVGFDAAMAGNGLSGLYAVNSYGSQIPLEAISGFGGGPGGAAGSAAGAAGMDFGVQGAGLLGPAGVGSSGALLSAAGSAVGGGGVGYLIGSKMGATNNQSASALGGAAGGAAMGFAVGGPPGAVIGAIAGGLAGLFGASSKNKQMKEADTAADAAAANQARPQAVNTVKGALDDLTATLPRVQQVVAANSALFSDFKIPAGWEPGEREMNITQAVDQIARSKSVINDWLYKNEPGQGHEAISVTQQMGQITPLVKASMASYGQAKIMVDAIRSHLASKGVTGVL